MLGLAPFMKVLKVSERHFVSQLLHHRGLDIALFASLRLLQCMLCVSKWSMNRVCTLSLTQHLQFAAAAALPASAGHRSGLASVHGRQQQHQIQPHQPGGGHCILQVGRFQFDEILSCHARSAQHERRINQNALQIVVTILCIDRPASVGLVKMRIQS